MISAVYAFQSNFYRQMVSVSCTRKPMHKTPAHIARSLRAFRNAHRLGLLQSVRVSPGRDACEAALKQVHIEYMGHAVPRLPLTGCTRAICECSYVPIGGGKLTTRLRTGAGVTHKRPPK